MYPWGTATTLGVICVALSVSAAAQTLPFPISPPLPPLPPLPAFGERSEPDPSENGVSPDPGPLSGSAMTVLAPKSGLAPKSDTKSLILALTPSSAAELSALERSRVHANWYGWQTLSTDSAAVAVLLVGSAIVTTRPPTLQNTSAPRPMAVEVASLGVYALGAPWVHLLHGNGWTALESVALRAVAPVAGFAIGLAVRGARGQPTNGAGNIEQFGAILATAGAVAVDASALAWERRYSSNSRATSALARFRVSF